MKKKLLSLLTMCALLLSGCGANEEPPECGGTVDRSDPNAPKTISSTELTKLTAHFFRFGGSDGGYYDFTLERDESGALILSEDSTFKVSDTADDALLEKVQSIIAANDLAARNGTDCYTEGLPDPYQPCRFTAEYASGEKLFFSENNDPEAQWSAQLLALFRRTLAVNYPMETATPAGREALAAYDRFLSGEEALHFDIYNEEAQPYCDYDIAQYFTAGSSCTVAEFREKMQEFYRTEGGSDVQFDKAYIDCGSDGVPELVLRTKGVAYYDDLTKEFIVKQLDGALQVCYVLSAAYRSNQDIDNAAGIISSYGSVSAWEHVFSRSVIDANGTWKLIWRTDEIDGFGQMDDYVYPVLAAAVQHYGEEPDSLVMTAYVLADDPFAYEPGTADFFTVERYDPATYDPADSSDIYEEGSEVRALFESVGAELVTPAEAQERVAQREQETGLSDLLTVYEELTYTPIFEN